MTITLLQGDCRELIADLGDASIDAIVTDPPYALVSIVKPFRKTSTADDTQTSDRSRRGADGYARLAKGFMGKEWDNGATAFDVAFWADCLRVLKPGGHVVAFGGTRTYHRLACAIEDAGFEIRDQLAWAYGSGFPKSHNVSKGIDKANGDERPVVGTETLSNDIRGGALLEVAHGGLRPGFERNITVAASAASAAWEGWGTALKPAWEPIVLARKPLSEKTVAANVLKWGTGALNIDGCRVPTDEALGGGNENLSARAHTDGWDRPWHHDPEPTAAHSEKVRANVIKAQALGRWPANIVHDGSDEVIAAFPESGGQQAPVGPANGAKSSVNVYGDYGPRDQFNPRGDSGSAARFFYSAKADADDRFGSKHPTVKPVDLMRWLVRLVTRPGGVVLDPFAGSGTTGVAALAEGMSAILCEREAAYVADIRLRIAHAEGSGGHSLSVKHRNKPVDHGPLFE